MAFKSAKQRAFVEGEKNDKNFQPEANYASNRANAQTPAPLPYQPIKPMASPLIHQSPYAVPGMTHQQNMLRNYGNPMRFHKLRAAIGKKGL